MGARVFVFVGVVFNHTTVAALVNHVGRLLVLLALMFVVEIGTLVTGKGAGSTKRSRGSDIAMDIRALLFSFAAIPDLLGTSSDETTGDGGNDLFLLAQNALARPFFLLIVNASSFLATA
ncbi:hypothetical protein RRF57_010461 [Xylaria bambusicola]|uniref:Uncharacterized protein n=1 Tax=Xylaria bambusicola TaxID=326684 RepID=A0AAN7ZD07_9PEZI